VTIYNAKQGLFSVPRLLVSNFINFFATWRATKTYFAYRIFGAPIVWLKTAHVFPGVSELSEYERSIEDLLVAEGLVTHEQIVAALKVEKGASVPLALLRLGLLDEKQFTDVWAKYSRLEIRSVTPSEISDRLLKQFGEVQSAQLNAIPVGERNGIVLLALREPPAEGLLETLRAGFAGKAVQAVLARPSNIRFVRDRVYPRLVLPPSRLEAALGRFQQAAGAAAPVFLEALINASATRRSLPDTLVDRGLIDEAAARKLWAEVFGCAGWDTRQFTLDDEAYRKFGPGFWWLHRLLPAGNGNIIAGAMPHSRAVSWIGAKLGGQPALLAELPDKVELAARASGIALDPDLALVNRLVTDGVLKKGSEPDVKELRTLIADPIPKWLLLQKIATDEQLHRAFLEIAGLPAAEAWTTEEVRRLLPILPPGFAVEHGCYPLQETGGAVRLGLAQMPSEQVLREIYDRLGGYPLCFEALNFADAARLRSLVMPG